MADSQTRDPTHHQRAANWVKHQLAMRRLREVATALEARGVPVLPVKGILLAHTLYDDVTERPLSDVDLRIRRRDFPTAMALGRELGWPIEAHAPRLWEAEIHFAGCPVELESTLGPPGLCAISVAELLERATRGTRFGFPCREPEIHDHALVLCINAFKDMLSPPPWTAEDIARIVRRPEFSVDLFCALARRGRVVTAIALVMQWLRDTRGDAICGAVHDTLGGPARPGFARGYRWLAEHRVLSPYDGLFVPSVASDAASLRAQGVGYALYGWVRGGLMRRTGR